MLLDSRNAEAQRFAHQVLPEAHLRNAEEQFVKLMLKGGSVSKDDDFDAVAAASWQAANWQAAQASVQAAQASVQAANDVGDGSLDLERLGAVVEAAKDILRELGAQRAALSGGPAPERILVCG